MTSHKSDYAIGYAAGIITGVAYGTNPLFAKGLLEGGASVSSMLFFRYIIATAMMALLMICRKESFRVTVKQLEWLVILGLFYSASSLFLFESYKFIAAGLATTIVYLYPIFTALLMLLMHRKPTWQVWVATFATLGGVFIMTNPFGGGAFNWKGLVLSALSALAYALYLVCVNNSKQMKRLSADIITFYALAIGSILFIIYHSADKGSLLQGLGTWGSILDLLGLALVPTMVAMLALAISTKAIGATRTAVLGVFEPITAIAIGTLVFDEAFTPNIAIGVAVCIAAVLFMIQSREPVGTGKLVRKG